MPEEGLEMLARESQLIGLVAAQCVGALIKTVTKAMKHLPQVVVARLEAQLPGLKA